nr:glycosyltransferase family A protein [Acinetobacter oleivorans]
MRISFCTTCKGRLWQLRQTLPGNLKMLDEHSEIILLDYQSPDGLKDWIFENFREYLENGQLKYFQMVDDYAYTSAYAKNVAHRLATGDILFNLDGDNYIYDGLLYELRLLKDYQLFLPRLGIENEGILGRVGYTRDAFYRLQGYNETLVGLKGDDGDLRVRAHQFKYFPIHASYRVAAIQNTREQKDKYVNNGEIKNYDKPSPLVNYPQIWGKADVIDRHGNMIKVG